MLVKWQNTTTFSSKHLGRDHLAYSVTVRILAQNNLYTFITVLQYKADLNIRIKFICVAIMSLCSRDIIEYYYDTMNSE